MSLSQSRILERQFYDIQYTYDEIQRIQDRKRMREIQNQLKVINQPKLTPQQINEIKALTEQYRAQNANLLQQIDNLSRQYVQKHWPKETYESISDRGAFVTKNASGKKINHFVPTDLTINGVNPFALLKGVVA